MPANIELATMRRKKGYQGTGYPWELTTKEVITILSHYPKTFDESIEKKFTFSDVFLFEGNHDILLKLRMDANVLKDKKELYRLSYQKWKYLSEYMIRHLAIITPEMQEIIGASEVLKNTFLVRQGNVLPAVDGKSAQLVISQDNTETPLAKIELVRMEITEKLLDKASMALDYMTPMQIRKASIGTKAKMVENMIKAYTMFKGEGATPQFTKINIKNMNVLQARELSRKAAES